MPDVPIHCPTCPIARDAATPCPARGLARYCLTIRAGPPPCADRGEPFDLGVPGHR